MVVNILEIFARNSWIGENQPSGLWVVDLRRVESEECLCWNIAPDPPMITNELGKGKEAALSAFYSRRGKNAINW